MQDNETADKKSAPTRARHVHASQTAQTDEDPDDFTRFQLDILAVLGRNGPTHGLGIKDVLDERYQAVVNHGRLYPNLDKLVQRGLIDKGRLDGRTNEYALTDAGIDVLHERASFVSGGYLAQTADNEEDEQNEQAVTLVAGGGS